MTPLINTGHNRDARQRLVCIERRCRLGAGERLGSRQRASRQPAALLRQRSLRTALYRIGGRSQNIDFGDVSFDRRSPSSPRCLLTRTICETRPSPGAECSQWLHWPKTESAGQRATSTGPTTPVCQLPPPGRTTCVRYVPSLVGPSGTFVRVTKCVYA